MGAPLDTRGNYLLLDAADDVPGNMFIHDAIRSAQVDSPRLKKARLWRSFYSVMLRSTIQQILDSISPGRSMMRERLRNGRRAPVLVYHCGCRVPCGYPLYRPVVPCERHTRALEG